MHGGWRTNETKMLLEMGVPAERILAEQRERDAAGGMTLRIIVFGIAISGVVNWAWLNLALDLTSLATLAIWWRPLLVMAILAFAFALYWVRKRFPRLFAFGELIASSTAAWIALDSASNLEVFAKVVAAMFLVVKAREHWAEGSKQEASESATLGNDSVRAKPAIANVT